MIAIRCQTKSQEIPKKKTKREQISTIIIEHPCVDIDLPINRRLNCKSFKVSQVLLKCKELKCQLN